MSQLSAQSIRKLCRIHEDRERLYGTRPMISPFLAEKTVINGKSAGLSACSYDIRSATKLVLGPHPGYIFAEAFRMADLYPREVRATGDPYSALVALRRGLTELQGRMAPAHNHPCCVLGVSLEHFVIPHNVSGYVCDKSTYARLHVTAFNTLFDPGFEGHATLEIVNLSDQQVVIEAGDPICQLVFHWLDEATDRPYEGKFQNQPARPVGPRLEQADGSYVELYHDDKI